jgi:hypothetical protein
MAFADDVALLGRNSATLTEALQHTSEDSGQLGLRINTDKTKYMMNTREKGRFQGVKDLELEGKRYERVAEFIYHGELVKEDSEVRAEVRARIASGNRFFHVFIRLLKASMFPRKLQLTVYHVIIRPVVLYGCETWTLSECDKNQPRVWERKDLRKIFGAGGVAHQDG